MAGKRPLWGSFDLRALFSMVTRWHVRRAENGPHRSHRTDYDLRKKTWDWLNKAFFVGFRMV